MIKLTEYALRIISMTLVVSKSNTNKGFEQMSVSIYGQEIEQVQSFIYLGSCITDDG